MDSSVPRVELESEPTVDTVTGGEVPVTRKHLERGVCVGRYVVVGWVGEGGMGVVYKAYDPELERAVALKLLHASGDPDSSSATSRRDRLLREAKALARLSHPNVLAVFDVGTFGHDVFLATEFVEGPTLADWLKEEKRSRAEILRAMIEAGEGLAAAHRANLVHRDFKPANAIVAKDGRVRVLDFGLARAEPVDALAEIPRLTRPASQPPEEATGPATPHALSRAPLASDGMPLSNPAGDLRTSAGVRVEATSKGGLSSIEPPDSLVSQHTGATSPGLLDLTITQHGQILGTPRFMAPEQHLGRTADARSDQFSFCLSLYEALYGEFPFEGKGEAYATNVTRGRIRNAPAGSDVPRWLRAVVVRGLALAPADRFASMDGLLAALRNDPMVARRRWGAIAGGALVLAGLGLAARHARPAVDVPCRGAERKLAGIWDAPRKQAMRAAFVATGSPSAEDTFRRTSAALDDYARGWVTMHTDACEATQVRGEQSAEMLDLRVQCLNEHLEELRAQVDVFTQADESAMTKSIQAARALPHLQACADSAALRAPIRPPSDEATRTRVDALRTSIAQAKAQQRAGNYAGALAIAAKTAEDAQKLAYRPVEAESLYVLGDVQDDQGDYATSERTFRQSFAASLAGHHEAQGARSLTALVAEVGLRQARFAEAHDWAALAEAQAERLTDPFAKGELARNEGRLFVREENYEAARVAIQKCLSIWEPALGSEDYAFAGPLTDLGNVYFLEGNSDAARAEYGRSLAILEKVLGPDSPSLGPNLNNLGEIALGRGEYDAAVESLTRAHVLWERAFGPAHPKVALTLFNLSRARRAQGELVDSKAMAERALAIWRKALPAEHPDVALGMHGVAEALRAVHDYAGALAMEEGALAMRVKIFGPNGAALAESLVSIGETRLAEGLAVTTAIEPLARAVRILEQRKSNPIELGEAKFDLARAVAFSEGARSRALAGEARAAYAEVTSPLASARIAEVDAWLARGGRP